MEVDSGLSSLLRNLKMEDPWIPPKSWDSIPSESGAAARSGGTGRGSRDWPTYDLSTISEAILVRLVINALQGVKSALVEIDKLSDAFCSTPADRTFHQVPSLWCRSISTSALGKMLKSISHSGLVFYFLHEFVNYYRCASVNVIIEGGEKHGGGGEKHDQGGENCVVQPGVIHHKNEMKMHPPYSLVNQAFSVAVGKILEGYLSALNTLLASVRLRCSVKSTDAPADITDGAGILTSVVHSDITILEVYLHTEEMRTHIEALGNVCFHNVADLTSCGEIWTADTTFAFQNFPRGADLLTYLYVQLRDADPGHHALLKFLFVHSCEPYCGFIKSWIYCASIDDPYEEFFVVYSDMLPASNGVASFLHERSSISMKEQDCIFVPCFLKDVCSPLLRAGQQLQVLVELLNLCNFGIIEEYAHCDLASPEDILPYWFGVPGNSASLFNPLTFYKESVEAVIHERDIMYGTMLEKLQNFFTKLDGRHQSISRTVIPFHTMRSLLGKRRGSNAPFSLGFSGDLNVTSTTNEQGVNNVSSDHEDKGASGTSHESSDEVESLQSSEYSSLYSYEEEIDPKGHSDLHDIAKTPSQFLSPNLCTCNSCKSILQNFESEKPSSQVPLHKCESRDPIIISHQHKVDGKLNKSSLPFTLELEKCATISETIDEGFQFGRCWPLGGLQKNPFYADVKCGVSRPLHSDECNLQKTDGNTQTLEGEESYFCEMSSVPFDSELDSLLKAQLISDRHGTLSLSINRSWSSCDYYDLNINPMLAKASWLPMVRKSRHGSSMNNKGPFPYFDFSSVDDPCKIYTECMLNSPSGDCKKEALTSLSSSVPAVGANAYSSEYVQCMTHLSGLSDTCSSKEANHPSKVLPPSVSGGARWEELLNNSGDNVPHCTQDTRHGLAAVFETPLDVIIDKCLVQKILLQYKYVSNFTIKLLDKGFDLREHLLALRRYHFMEIADWVDSFIISLRNQKWNAIESDQKIIKIQGLLDVALQKSSCESDLYKERLFVYMKGQSMLHQSTSAIGIHSFEFIMLGYRVDWPVNIIITRDALQIYAEIFNFLLQIRLAVSSLADVWHFLKAPMSSTKENQHMESRTVDFTAVLNVRHQINYFVSTLQQYVHSQLADVSWCRFENCFKHQVKDMLDIEAVHMAYLADALNICFLSAETAPVATIIRNILQCALDFRLCLSSCDLNIQSCGNDSLDLHSRINFTQVSAIRTTFEKCIKDLYILYLKSPKHGELSLCRFWGHLNYNDFYSVTISKEMGSLYL